MAVVPDEDPDLEPTVHIHSGDEHVVPYEIMLWFMEKVAEEVERCRATLAASVYGGSCDAVGAGTPGYSVAVLLRVYAGSSRAARGRRTQDLSAPPAGLYNPA